MTILGLWAIVVGYTVLYAGTANLQGSSISLADAFTGQGQITCAGKQVSEPTAPAPATSGSGGLGGRSWAWA